MESLIYSFAILIVATIGFMIAWHIHQMMTAGRRVLCPISRDCSLVLKSHWAKLFGVRGEVLGLVYYSFMLALAVGALAEPQIAPLAVYASSIAAAAGLYFAAIQLFVIKHNCSWTLGAVGINILLFWLAVLLNQTI